MQGDRPLFLEQRQKFDRYTIPIDFSPPFFPDKSLYNYNMEPVKYYNELVASGGIDPSPILIGKILFFSQISPHAISQILFIPRRLPLKFLHSFFLAPIIEYMDFLHAVSILFSRIALPNSTKYLKSIFKYSGRVLHQNGFYPIISSHDVSVIVKLCVYYSSLKSANSDVSLIDFTKKCYQLGNFSKLKPLTLELLYQELTKRIIPLYFTFCDPRYPPNCEHQGILSIRSHVMRKMKRRHFRITNDVLVYALEDTPDQYLGGVEIDKLIFIAPAPKEKDPNSFMLVGKHEENIVFDIEKGKRMPSDKQSLVLFADSHEDLEGWRSSLMFYSFRNTLTNLIEK